MQSCLRQLENWARYVDGRLDCDAESYEKVVDRSVEQARQLRGEIRGLARQGDAVLYQLASRAPLEVAIAPSHKISEEAKDPQGRSNNARPDASEIELQDSPSAPSDQSDSQSFSSSCVPDAHVRVTLTCPLGCAVGVQTHISAPACAGVRVDVFGFDVHLLRSDLA